MLPHNPIKTYQEVEEATSTFLARHPQLAQEADEDYLAVRNVADLLPVSFDNIFSGHYFPVSEAHDELGRSVSLARIGYYQYALMGLRWVLELGFLSVYWDRHDNAGTEIKGWLRSEQSTPFKRDVIKGLLEVQNISTYAAQAAFVTEFDEVYGELSNYAHIRGVRYSSHGAYRGNIIRFNEGWFQKWALLRRRVARLVCTVHLLKYPVALQYTPMFDKFGFNPPAGGFIEPGQAEQISALFSSEEWALLKSISDSDETAVSLAEWVNSLPDIAVEVVAEQSRNFDRDIVRNQGFTSWFQMHSQLYTEGSDAHARFESWAKELQRWAALKGWIDHGEHGPLPEIRTIPGLGDNQSP